MVATQLSGKIWGFHLFNETWSWGLKLINMNPLYLVTLIGFHLDLYGFLVLLPAMQLGQRSTSQVANCFGSLPPIAIACIRTFKRWPRC
jgi:hypothetical protein